MSKVLETSKQPAKCRPYHRNQKRLQTALRQTFAPMESILNDSVYTPKTNDQFISKGYIQNVIEPSERLNELVEPFAVWKKKSSEGVELEVVGSGAIFSWSDTYEDAEDALIKIILDLKQTLHEPNESFSSSLIVARQFVETVTGDRHLIEEA